MTAWIITAFFVGALFGGVAMSCLAAGGRAEKAENIKTVDNRFSTKNKGEKPLEEDADARHHVGQ